MFQLAWAVQQNTPQDPAIHSRIEEDWVVNAVSDPRFAHMV